MEVTRLKAKNWRNFTEVDFSVGDRLFVVGPHAAGKSNLLDILRFLGDIAGDGGGLTSAVMHRRGLSSIASLFAHDPQENYLAVDVELADKSNIWRYYLAITGEGGNLKRPQVHREEVSRNGQTLLQRPNAQDESDPERLSQTHLEQISANLEFRPVAEFFAQVQYVHLIPQLIRDPIRAENGGRHDPYGANFIADISNVSPATRNEWLGQIQRALQAAVPNFDSLRLEVDLAGRPHLVAGYRNWRSEPANQSEASFSDGTLRLIGLLWTVVSAPAGSCVLLEEPELSLDPAIVRIIPTMLAKAQRSKSMQVLVSTHAPELLDDEGVIPGEILVLQVTRDGSTASLLSEVPSVADEIAAGLPTSQIVSGLFEPPDLMGLTEVGRRR